VSSTIFSEGAPVDDERPDKITVTFKTPNQGEELAARFKREAERIASEGGGGAVTLSGRKR
jgi:hypothetical protein